MDHCLACHASLLNSVSKFLCRRQGDKMVHTGKKYITESYSVSVAILPSLCCPAQLAWLGLQPTHCCLLILIFVLSNNLCRPTKVKCPQILITDTQANILILILLPSRPFIPCAYHPGWENISQFFWPRMTSGSNIEQHICFPNQKPLQNMNIKINELLEQYIYQR